MTFAGNKRQTHRRQSEAASPSTGGLGNWRSSMALTLTALLMALFATAARADVWGYVDGQGVAHFSAEPLDERYEIFFRGNETFAAGKGAKDLPPSAGINAAAGAAAATPGAYAAPKLRTFFDMSPSYKAVKHLLRDASATHGIDYELLQAVIATESGFDTYAVSPKGAVGLMQLIPPTAERYGVRADKNSPVAKKLTDAKTNIKAGSRYLRDLIDMFPGQLELAIAAYNAGEGAVHRAGNKIPNFPETRNYVKTVLQLYAYLKPPDTVAQVRKSAVRVRMEMMGGNVAGTTGRANMVPSAVALPEDPSGLPTLGTGQN